MGAVDDYIASVADPDRRVLEDIRTRVLARVPDATQGMSYAMPAYLHNGWPVLAAVSTAKHIGLYPFSSAVVTAIAPDLDAGGFGYSKGAIRVTRATPLPDQLLERILELRLAEIATHKAR